MLTVLQQVEEQKRFAATPYSGNDLGQVVVPAVEQFIQIHLSFYYHRAVALDFCVYTHFSAAKIINCMHFTKDFCVFTHFSNVN